MASSCSGNVERAGADSDAADDEAVTAARSIRCSRSRCARSRDRSRRFSRQRGLDLLLFDVGVRPDLLGVLVLLEGLHQLDHLLRRLAFELDVVLRQERDLGGAGLDAERPSPPRAPSGTPRAPTRFPSCRRRRACRRRRLRSPPPSARLRRPWPCRRRCSPSCRTSRRRCSRRRGCRRTCRAVWRISPTVRFLLSVSVSMMIAAPPGP